MRAGRAVAITLALVLSACTATESQSPSVPASAESSAAASASARPTATPQPESAFAGAWVDATAETIGATAEWTNRVELADIDADGDVDILFANGGNYEVAGEPVASRAFLNRGDGTFEDSSAAVFGDLLNLIRVIKVRDLNADGVADILMGAVYGEQHHLLLGTGGGAFTDVSGTSLPGTTPSAGDLEIGDVDADGDLDVVIADWGEEGPFGSGGRVNLWLNDGAGAFTDATDAAMPETLVQFSWDIELVDVDNDWDLDAAVSCKQCPSSLLYENDGSGTFTDVTDGGMPATTNNYEFAPIDLDADGFFDLVTINDGLASDEHVFRNDGGSFVDMTDTWWPNEANPGFDDNNVVALDIDSDGDADFLIGSLDGPDRLLINDGTGVLSLADDVFAADPSRGTLGLELADLNGDGRLDAVEAQGETPGHEDERVYLGSEVLPVDSAPPVVTAAVLGPLVVARVHDNRTPNMPHDWTSVVLRWSGGEEPMTWYGENLFRVPMPSGASAFEVCAIDAAGNEACAGPS